MRVNFLNSRWLYLLTFMLLTWSYHHMFYPGYHVTDTQWQLGQASNPSKPVSDWHPPIETYSWKAISALTGNTDNMFFWNLLLVLGGLGLILSSMIANVDWGNFLYLIIGLSPTYFVLLPYFHKDIPFAGSLMFATGLLLYSEEFKNRFLVFLAGAFLFYALLLRHNGLFAIIPFCVYLTFRLVGEPPKSSFKQIAIWSVAIFSFFLSSANLCNWAMTKRKMYPAQMQFIYDVAGASYYSNDFLFSKTLPNIRNGLFDLSTLKKSYSPDSAYSLFFASDLNTGFILTEEEFKSVRHDWWHMLATHPLSYARHRLNCFYSFVSHQGDGHEIATEDYERTVQYFEIRGLTGILLYQYAEAALGSSFDWLWNKCFYLCLYLFVILAVRFFKIRLSPAVQAAYWSGLFYLFSYLVIGVSYQFKYALWSTMIIMPIAISTASHLISRYILKPVPC